MYTPVWLLRFHCVYLRKQSGPFWLKPQAERSGPQSYVTGCDFTTARVHFSSRSHWWMRAITVCLNCSTHLSLLQLPFLTLLHIFSLHRCEKFCKKYVWINKEYGAFTFLETLNLNYEKIFPPVSNSLCEHEAGYMTIITSADHQTWNIKFYLSHTQYDIQWNSYRTVRPIDQELYKTMNMRQWKDKMQYSSKCVICAGLLWNRYKNRKLSES